MCGIEKLLCLEIQQSYRVVIPYSYGCRTCKHCLIKNRPQGWYQPSYIILQNVPAEVTEGEEEKEEVDEQEDEDEQEEHEKMEACVTVWESHPDVDGGWAWVILIAMFGVFVITSGNVQNTHTHTHTHTPAVKSIILKNKLDASSFVVCVCACVCIYN